jgi:DNA invertase Pin-like site-specific DNA recombinase
MALADRLGWEVAAHFDDNDTSAYNKRKRRPGYEALLDAMKAGEVEAVICWHTDRLYRRLGDLERLIEVAEAARVDIRTVQGGDLDLSTSAGRMVARILGSVANAESEHKGERHKAANDQKAAAGKWQTANRTFGYTMTGEPLEPESSAVRKAVADVMAGKSIQGVARDWNAAGLRTTLKGTEWNGPRVRRLLVNPRYAALKVHRGNIVGPGAWTPLIDSDTHRALVTMLSDPSRLKCSSFERKYLGSGLYLCGVCADGTTMKAAMPGNKADGTVNRRGRAYVCRRKAHLLRSGEPLDDFVTAQVLERMTREDASGLLGNEAVDVSALTAQREALQGKLDKITEMFNDDAIAAEQFAATSRSTRSKLAVVDQQLADVTRTSPAAALIAAGEAGAWKLWQSMSVTQRAEAVDEVATVTVLPAPRGRRTFDHSYIDVTFRRDV